MYLNVIIKDKVSSAVFLQELKCIMVGKIFKLINIIVWKI